jgi:hypothetical protein
LCRTDQPGKFDLTPFPFISPQWNAGDEFEAVRKAAIKAIKQ